MKNSVKIYLKGMLMGICDIIPGISGGTIAFITGIYARLINAVKSFSPSLILDLFQYPKNKGKLIESIKKLDLIFLDPPYKEKNIKIILENIAKLKLLKESGLIVLHRHKKIKDDIGNKFTIKRTVRYGISKIIFVKIN